ncbi:MAG: ATP-grasp domain-containing protein [Steroidobacteraceae bacterium]
MATQHRPVVIVTDGMRRKSLSAIRSLGKSGFCVHVFGDTWLTVGFWSRFTRRRVIVPDAKDDSAAFGGLLFQHLRDIRTVTPDAPRPVLIPMDDESLRYVVENSKTLEAYADFIVPTPAQLAVCADKAATMALAARLNIPHPRTESADSGPSLIAGIRRMSGEFVVKPIHGAGSRGVRYNPTFAANEAEAYLNTYGPALVQERVPPEGQAIGVSVLFDRDGKCLARFCHKRLSQFPNSGGPSTDRIGIADDSLLNMSLRMLQKIEWRGIAMVEWKIDPRNSTPMLMEINPRFWGSLELAVRSGVDFPVLYAHAAAGHSEVAPEPVLGRRCRWLIPGDVLRWLKACKSERESFAVFCSGLPFVAEEWDSRDLPGFIACIVCQGLAVVLLPKYRKLLHR